MPHLQVVTHCKYFFSQKSLSHTSDIFSSLSCTKKLIIVRKVDNITKTLTCYAGIWKKKLCKGRFNQIECKFVQILKITPRIASKLRYFRNFSKHNGTHYKCHTKPTASRWVNMCETKYILYMTPSKMNWADLNNWSFVVPKRALMGSQLVLFGVKWKCMKERTDNIRWVYKRTVKI